MPSGGSSSSSGSGGAAASGGSNKIHHVTVRDGSIRVEWSLQEYSFPPRTALIQAAFPDPGPDGKAIDPAEIGKAVNAYNALQYEKKTYRVTGADAQKFPVLPLEYWGTRAEGHEVESQSIRLDITIDQKALPCTFESLTVLIRDGSRAQIRIQRPAPTADPKEKDADSKAAPALAEPFANVPFVPMVHATIDDSDEKTTISHFRYVFSIDRLLHALGARINKNLIYAAASVRGSTNETEVPLHVLLQRAVVLLPGILATEISIDNKTCWPAPGTTAFGLMAGNKDALLSLMSNSDGSVLKQPSSLRVIQAPAPTTLLRSALGSMGFSSSTAELNESIGGPYHIHRWTGLMNAAYPPLYCGEERLYHIYLQEYPYDWRVAPPTFITSLLGQVAPIAPTAPPLPDRPVWTPAEPPPSLRTLIQRMRRRLPFLAPRIAVAGHSTGGVILNGLVRRDGVQGLLDKAFFIGTPFRGAVKAYNAFLTGSMDLGQGIDSLVGNTSAFQQLGPNLATIYYLAPTPDYPLVVAKVEQRLSLAMTSYKRPTNPADFMSAIVQGLREDEKQRPDQKWNPALQQAADLYSRSNSDSPILIGADNCRNFYSSYQESTKDTTYGCVVYDGSKTAGQRYTTERTAGDGTVPAPSLIGIQLPANRMHEFKGPDHVGITNVPEVWALIAAEMALCDEIAHVSSLRTLIDAGGRAAPPPAPRPPHGSPPAGAPGGGGERTPPAASNQSASNQSASNQSAAAAAAAAAAAQPPPPAQRTGNILNLDVLGPPDPTKKENWRG